MKFYHLFSIILIVLHTTIAKKAQREEKRNEGVNLKSKRAETSDECKYINSMLGEDEFYNCCEFHKNSSFNFIQCENGHITGINLSYNHFFGSIPESIGNLTYLEELNLHYNNLSGSIPKSIGNLTKLWKLDLSINNLSGNIPESIGKLSNLISLKLKYNQLSGSIPKSIGNLTQLEDLLLDHNQLSGSIPESLSELSNIQDIKLYNNKLSGTIPESLGKIDNYQLYIGNNNLSGAIPESFKSVNFYNFDFTGNCIDCSLAKQNESWSCKYDNTKESKCASAITVRCGKGIGSCPDGQCCSKKGYCGTTSAYCSVSQGCQNKYGKCNTSKKVVTVTKKKIVTLTKLVKLHKALKN